MKILLLNASPHKGNTWTLMCAVRDAILKTDSDVIFEEIHLHELNLPLCLGCSLCFRKGHSFCPHYSMMQEILNKIEESDGLIFGASTFNMAPNALAKNLIDHLSYQMHRPQFFHGKALAVSTTGGVFAEKNVKYLTATLRGLGFNSCYGLPVAAYSWNAYRPSLSDRKKITKISNKFYKDVSSGRLHPPKTGQIISYNMFRGLGLAYVEGTEYATADGNYWTDPARAGRLYDASTKLPVCKKPLGYLFYHIGKLLGRHITVTYKK